MKRKKILVGIIAGILLGLLLTSDIRSIVSMSSEPYETKSSQLSQEQSTDSQKLETNSGCGIIRILGNLKENWVKSGLKAQSEIKSLSGKRPTDPGGGTDGNQHLLPKLYNTTRFILHWTDDGSSVDHVPPQDLDGNGTPDIVEGFAEAFEYVWKFLINTTGFPAPPSDASESNDALNRNPDGKYDVFIYCFGYWGYAYPEQWPNSPSYSHIGVRNSLGNPKLRQVVAAHEFFHAIQFVYDCAEEPWWQETTATYMEGEVYPDVNDNYQYLLKWFLYCDTYGLEYTNVWHEYGNFIFAKRLSEDLGDEIVKEIWEEMISTNGTVAIENVLVGKNSSLVNEFSKFSTANFFLEDMYVDGADYRDFITGKTDFNGVWIEYQYNASIASNYTEINETNINRDCWMDRWATDYITMRLDPAKSRYKISFDGLDLTTNYLVKLVTKKDGVINETIFNLNGEKNGYLDLVYDSFDNVTLIIANAGNTETTKPSWRVTIEIVSEIIGVHDIAVTNITPSKTVVGQGYGLNLNVTVANQGDYTEVFNITTYANTTIIQIQTVTLESNASTTIAFVWNTTGFAPGKYILSSCVEYLPEETDTEDNIFTDGIVTVTVTIIFLEGPFYWNGVEYWIVRFERKSRPVRLVSNYY
jgi:hypothetical protein